MFCSSHSWRPSTKTKSLGIPCFIEVNTNMMAPTSKMLWTAETISGFWEPMLPSMVSLALTSTLKILGTLLSASQLMDFAHFRSTKKPAGQSWSITTTWAQRFISGSVTFCVLALFLVHTNLTFLWPLVEELLKLAAGITSGKNLTCFNCLWCLWLSLGAFGWI